MPFLEVQQNNATRTLPFLLVLSSDHITGATGKSPVVSLSKNGASGVTPAGAITEVDAVNLPGWYQIAANATDANTLGALAVHATATLCDPADYLFEVVAYNPDDSAGLGLSRIDTTISSRLAFGPVTVGTNNDKTGYSLASNAVDAAQFTQAAADKVWTSAARTLTAFSQAFSDQAWTSATRTLTAFSQGFSDQVWTSASRTLTAFSQAFSDQTWASATRTLTAFSQSFADQVWASATRTLTSLGTVVADVATAVWAFATRTLTQTAAQVIAVVSGTDVIIHRGDTTAASFSGLGNLTGRTKLWFTVKHDNADADSAALIQIIESSGLAVLNGAPATPSQGSIVVTNPTTGALTVNLAAAASALLVPNLSCHYDLQVLIGTTVTTLTTGSFTVQADQTRSTS